MRLVKDGRNDFHKFWGMMENCAITFSMQYETNGVYKIANKAGTLIRKFPIPGDITYEYYIAYEFEPEDTNEVGVFTGEFNIIFFDTNQNNLEIGNLKVPIQEELYIHVIDSFTVATAT
jgi:hypothetical protein